MKAQVADLEKDFHIKVEAYGVIICFNYLQRSLITEMKNGLRRGGMIVYETYIPDQTQFGKPKNPDYLLKLDELLVRVWGSEYRDDVQLLRTWVNRLRQKVEKDPQNPELIGTMPKSGYILERPSSA